ncbi:MAG TPA: hypothetical protein VN086_02995 [Candidatus Paceibacterota bacterium]|nr:hypothetical protein [Candidatus Paceibacterota bacterium]
MLFGLIFCALFIGGIGFLMAGKAFLATLMFVALLAWNYQRYVRIARAEADLRAACGPHTGWIKASQARDITGAFRGKRNWSILTMGRQVKADEQYRPSLDITVAALARLVDAKKVKRRRRENNEYYYFFVM